VGENGRHIFSKTYQEHLKNKKCQQKVNKGAWHFCLPLRRELMKPLIIGITGGTGSGKTTVAQRIKDMPTSLSVSVNFSGVVKKRKE